MEDKKITWIADYKSRGKFIFGGRIEVGCSTKALWEFLATPGHLTKVHPPCKQHETEEWTGVGSKDLVIYKDGGKRIRTVIKWDVEQLLQLRVQNPANGEESLVSYILKKLPEKDHCEISVILETASYKKIPRPFWKFYARNFLLPQYKKYLGGLLSGFVAYVP